MLQASTSFKKEQRASSRPFFGNEGSLFGEGEGPQNKEGRMFGSIQSIWGFPIYRSCPVGLEGRRSREGRRPSGALRHSRAGTVDAIDSA